MAVLQKIRVKFGLAISIIIALALLSFIIDPNTLGSALNSMSSKYDVGVINGKTVTYTDFQEETEKFTQINDLLTGTSVKNEQQQAQIRDAAWQSLIDKFLFVKNAKEAGITVGDEEMVALTTGDMVSPILSQNAMFVNENGEYDSSKLVEFVQSMDADASGNYRLIWNYFQNTIYTQQFYAKYASLFSASAIQNPLMLSNAVEENNTTAEIEFAMFPFGFERDSSIVVSNKEIKDYYTAHQKNYKQQANRDIEYVVYEVVPSEEDINETSETVSSVYDEFASTDNMKSFLTKNSDMPYSEYWYKEGELNTVYSDANDFAFSNGVGSVSPIYRSDNNFFAVRVMDEAQLPDSAFVKHILIQGDDAAAKVDSLVEVVNKGGNFANLAALYSTDQSSAADGELGSIGWMTQTYMIPGFESVITAPVGKAFALKTQYGNHVVLVSKKSVPVTKKRVAILDKESLASKETFNDFYSKANKFATLADGTYEGYLAAVDTMGVYSHTMNAVMESTDSYGAITNAKEVTRWIFEAKEGKASNIITVNNNYFFIAAVKNIHKEGFAPVSEVAQYIEPTLYIEKYSEKKTAELAEKISGMTDMQQIADAFGTTVSTQSGVSFSSLSTNAVDPALAGAVAAAPEGKICGPIAGNVGIYAFKVLSRETGAFYTEDDARNLENQKMQYNSQLILPVMQEAADVKDNRARFY